MKQEMTEVEHKNSTNMPSQIRERESYFHGFRNGYLNAILEISKANSEVTVKALNELDNIIDNIQKRSKKDG